MRSQDIRNIAPEMDPLKLGMGWSVEDLSKPQIIVESTFGDSHPGSAHLFALWKPRTPKYKAGVLKLFAERAVSPMKGGYME